MAILQRCAPLGYRRQRCWRRTFGLVYVTALAMSLVSVDSFLCISKKPLSRLSLPQCASDDFSSSSEYQKVFVAGGSKGVGKWIVEKLAARGTLVVALVRREDSKRSLEISCDEVMPVLGDAFLAGDVANAMEGCDAVVTTLGGKTENKRIDYVGNKHVIEAATAMGIQRIVLVTSIGCGSSHAAAPPEVFEPLKEALTEKEKAEQLLTDSSDTNWTIIRPGGLVSQPRTQTAILTEDTKAIGSIHREDVADLVIRALDSPFAIGKVVTAMDPSLTASGDQSIKALVL